MHLFNLAQVYKISISLLHSQQFTNSKFHFLITAKSATSHVSRRCPKINYSTLLCSRPSFVRWPADRCDNNHGRSLDHFEYFAPFSDTLHSRYITVHICQLWSVSLSLAHTRAHARTHARYCMGPTFQRHCPCASIYPTKST